MPLHSQNCYKLSLGHSELPSFQTRALSHCSLQMQRQQLHLEEPALGRTGPPALCPYPTHMDDEGFTCVTKTILCTLSVASYLIGRVFEKSCLEAY